MPRTGSVLLLGLALLAGCGRRSPRPIAFGSEPCGHCHMTISDPRFSAELLTSTGKAYTFDDIGCMAAWLAEHPGESGNPWVTGLVDGQWHPADSVQFLRSAEFHTPMASGLIAVRPGTEGDSVSQVLKTPLLDWARVRQEAGTAPHGMPQ